MTAVVPFNPGQVPDFVKSRELSATALALVGNALGGNRISIKGGTFRLIVGGKEIASIEERYLDVVLVGAAQHISRTFYATKWSGEENVPPTCWSVDGEKPAPDVPPKQKQCDNCMQCPQNIKGSGEGDRKACRFQQRIAVVLANDIEGDVLSVTVPAKSLFGKGDGDLRPLQEYARWLAAQKVDPMMVVTRMRFDTSSESPKLFFRAMRWLTNDEFQIIERQSQSEDAKRAVEFSVSHAAQEDAPMDIPGERPAAAPAPAPAAKAAPAPAAQDDGDEPPPPAPATAKKRGRPAAAAPAPAEEPIPEPEVRRAAPAPATAVPQKPSSLAAAIADWDDE